MSKSLRLSLKSGQKLFINGAVLRVDRKVSLELMNEATFLLSHHIIAPESTSTPLKQLYFIIQTMRMDPTSEPEALRLCDEMLGELANAFENAEILRGLAQVAALIDGARAFDALKLLRRLLPLEASIIGDAATKTVQTEQKTELEKCR